MRLLLFFVLVLSLTLVEPVSAKKILFGENKGKEILKDYEIREDQLDTIIEENKKLQEKVDNTNELLKLLIKNHTENNQKLVELQSRILKVQVKLYENSIKKPESKKAEVVTTTSPNQTDILISETNRLLKKMLEEQKWLSTLLQGTVQEGLSN